MGDVEGYTGDVTIYNADRTKAITTTTDGSDERLDVSAAITGGSFQLNAFIPVVVIDGTGVVLNTSTYTTILDVTTTEGKLDFIGVTGGTSNYQVRLTIDATEIFDVIMSELTAIGLSNATNVPMFVETAAKNYRYHPNEGVDFSDSLKIEAKATSATPTVTSLITYREVI